jgi:hypothetical protein
VESKAVWVVTGGGEGATVTLGGGLTAACLVSKLGLWSWRGSSTAAVEEVGRETGGG